MKETPKTEYDTFRDVRLWINTVADINALMSAVATTKISADGFVFENIEELNQERAGKTINYLSIECVSPFIFSFNTGKEGARIYLSSNGGEAYGTYCRVVAILKNCKKPAASVLYNMWVSFPVSLIGVVALWLAKDKSIALYITAIALPAGIWNLYLLHFYKPCVVRLIEKQDSIGFWRRENIEKIAVGIIIAAILGIGGFAAGRLSSNVNPTISISNTYNKP